MYVTIWFHTGTGMELHFSVSASRFLIVLTGLLLAQVLVHHAAAQREVPFLRLLVLRSAGASSAAAKSAGVDDTAVPALSTREARAVTAAFIGRRIDDALLAEVPTRLRDYYTSIGRPFVEIAVPSQDVSAGTLLVNIVETRIGRIGVDGNRWFSGQQYTGAIRSRSGDPIDTKSLAGDTAWLNHDYHRHATISIEPTEQPFVYDLTVRASERLPLDITLVTDDAGTSDTGLYRIGLGADWSNAFWRGDDLSYLFLTSADQFRLLEHVLSYTAYLPWRDTLTISGLTADTKGRQIEGPRDISVNGHAVAVSIRYAVSLPGGPDFMQHIDMGYDFKSTNTNILAGGNSVFPSISELDQFVAGYGARLADLLGSTDVVMTLVASPGHLSSRNTQAALSAQQAGASPSYIYGRSSFERLTNLPSGTAWSAKLTAQYSSDALLPSEQLVFGGVQSVRGFMDLSATRDEGVVMQNEFRLAPFNPWLWPEPKDGATLTPFVFVDLAAGRNHFDLAGIHRSWLEMVSAGPGFTWQFTPTAALHLSWGFPVVRNGHTGPTLGPQFSMQITF